MALANMSTMMYLAMASEALRLGGPAYPAQRESLITSRKRVSLGSLVQTGWLCHILVGGTEKVSITSNHFSYCSLAMYQRMKSLASFWFLEYFISMLL